MGVISIQNVTRQFGQCVVLSDLSLELGDREIVGLVGPNGAGKTTLFRLITGQLAPDLGTVTRARGLEVGYLSQEPELNLANSLHDEVAEVFTELLDIEHRMHDVSERLALLEHGPQQQELLEQYDRLHARFEAAGGYKIEARVGEILGGLGFEPADNALPLSALSGGQKCRAALAKLLLRERGFLLLDEPTNHLDIDAVRWLEKFLKGHDGGVVVISHDRYLLDRLADRIVEIDRGRAHSYPGNYSSYHQAREMRRLTLDRQYEKDREFIEKERDFIARFLAGQRSKEAQGRRTRLERRLAAGEFVTERPAHRQRVRLRFTETRAKGGEILRVEDLGKSYGEKRLFAGLNLQVAAGLRLGITGPNGTGKSTLLKILLEVVPQDEGTVRWDSKLAIGYYAQESAELDPSRTIMEEIRADQPHLSEQHVRNHLGAFLFTGEDVFKPLGKLSGGEQSRVRLIKLILSNPDVLVLDEPTNHLDIPSREALEEALADYPGTIIAVSHDRYFLDRIVERLLVMRPEGHRLFAGNYTTYIETLESEQAKAAQAAQEAEDATPRATPSDKRRDGAAQRGGSKGEPPPSATREELRRDDPLARDRARYDSISIEAIEIKIYEHEQELTRLGERFSDPSVYRDAEKVEELQESIEAIKHELTVLQSAWDERAEYQ
ncbi:MAG: ABC-F family ATP-binding cassette domain-containing protein [Phycisphaerales bacterium]|nr:ABC-F family ATP-binding cassette domain-containing protein [Phycisphaerales bacterium]